MTRDFEVGDLVAMFYDGRSEMHIRVPANRVTPEMRVAIRQLMLETSDELLRAGVSPRSEPTEPNHG